ncbi:hypothetical protein [Actinomadura rupiterrae]|nr:hypothetical protein [Actinomadura rupiterrae]MCP2339075.1 hypothetical protein [Actinomadura rupiterrae]
MKMWPDGRSGTPGARTGASGRRGRGPGRPDGAGAEAGTDLSVWWWKGLR